MIVFLNGELVSEDQATVSVFDRSFQYGDGLFETILIANGRPFRWEQHLERLRRGAALLRISVPFSEPELRQAVSSLVLKNQQPEGILRVTLSRGVGERGYSTRSARHPTLVMSLHQSAGIHPDRPLRWTLTTPRFRVEPENPLHSLKTANKLLSVMARAGAEESGADEALLLNTHGEICETSSGNLFWFQKNILITPSIETGCLPGVTRAVMLELAPQMGLTVKESRAPLEELASADGAFVTLSSLGLVEVTALDGKSLSLCAYTLSLYSKYLRLIEWETTT